MPRKTPPIAPVIPDLSVDLRSALKAARAETSEAVTRLSGESAGKFNELDARLTRLEQLVQNLYTVLPAIQSAMEVVQRLGLKEAGNDVRGAQTENSGPDAAGVQATRDVERGTTDDGGSAGAVPDESNGK